MLRRKQRIPNDCRAGGQTVSGHHEQEDTTVVAYLIADIDVQDREKFKAYSSRVPELVAKHGGEFIVRAGEFEVIEGDWLPSRVIVIRFPDRQAIHNLHADPEYAASADVRRATAKSKIIAIDGIE